MEQVNQSKPLKEQGLENNPNNRKVVVAASDGAQVVLPPIELWSIKGRIPTSPNPTPPSPTPDKSWGEYLPPTPTNTVKQSAAITPLEADNQHLANFLNRSSNNKVLARSRYNLTPIPEAQQNALRVKFSNELGQLATRVGNREYSFLLDGSSQHLYVIQKTDTGYDFKLRTVISTGAKGFGRTVAAQDHKRQSKKTPYGMFEIAYAVRGNPGQIIEKGTPQRGFRSPNSGGRAEMLTTALQLRDTDPTISWKRSAEARGIYIHGTNKESLLGNKRSGGCIRTSNLDVIALDTLFKTNAANGNKTHVYIKH